MRNFINHEITLTCTDSKSLNLDGNLMEKLTKICEDGTYLTNHYGQLLFFEWMPNQLKNFYAYEPSNGLQLTTEETFSKAIGGKLYSKIERQLGDKIDNYSSTNGFYGERYFCNFQNGIIKGFDAAANKIYEWDTNNDEIGHGHAIYEIAFEPPHFMWLALPTGQTITKVSLATKKEVFRIGDYTFEEVYDPLSYPESLFINGNELFICNMGSGKLFRLDLQTLQLHLYRTFTDSLWEYIKIGETEYVKLDKAIYKIEP